jgi:hypothetical protein
LRDDERISGLPEIRGEESRSALTLARGGESEKASDALAYRIHRSRLGWFDLQLGRADPLRLFHRGEV